MARKDFYVAKDTPHPLYKTRMLQAGSPIPLDASAARLFRQLGVDLSEDAPKKAAPKAEAPAPAPEPAPAAEEAPKPAAKKAAPKKATRRKKS